MAEYKLAPFCTVDDAAGLARNNVSAFWDEPWWWLDWRERTKEQMIESFTARIPRLLQSQRDVRRHQKVVHVPSGEIVGYARWVLPESHADEWLEAQAPAVSPEAQERFEKQAAEAFWTISKDLPDVDSHIKGWRETLSPKEPHMQLDYLCCRPDHHRRGVASMLLQSALREADRMKLAICMVAMGNSALGAYSKHGFETLAEKHESLLPYADYMYHTYWEVRRPQ